MEGTPWRWAVELQGHVFDLEFLQRALRPEFSPCVLWLGPPHNAHVLVSPTLDDHADVVSVREEGLRLLALLNGAAAIQQRAKPAIVGRIFSHEGGRIAVHHVLVPSPMVLRSCVLSAELSVYDAEGRLVPSPPPAPSFAQRAVELASTDERVAYLLNTLGNADNWFDVYNVLDMLPHVAGEDWALLIGDDAKPYRDARREANCHRHIPPPRWPKNRPTLREALDLAARISHRVLEHRFAGRSLLAAGNKRV